MSKAKLDNLLFRHERGLANGLISGMFDVSILSQKDGGYRIGFLKSGIDKIGRPFKYVRFTNPLRTNGKIYFEFSDKELEGCNKVCRAADLGIRKVVSGEEKAYFEKHFSNKYFVLKFDEAYGLHFIESEEEA